MPLDGPSVAGRFSIWETAGDFRVAQQARTVLGAAGGYHSILDAAEAVHAGEDEIHFPVTVSRRRESYEYVLLEQRPAPRLTYARPTELTRRCR